MKPSDFKHKRESLELTQTQLGIVLDVGYQTISRYERGVVPIPRTVEFALFYLEGQKKGKK